jgi:DnaJ-class molecular chaperone
MKKNTLEAFYTGLFNDEPIELDITVYELCPSCEGTGENDWEFPVRCFTCCGDGYIKKRKEKNEK